MRDSARRVRVALCSALIVLTAAACEPKEPPGPQIRLFDAFDRPDSASLGAADTGQAWSSLAGAWGISGQAAAPGAGYSLSVVDSGGATGVAQVTVSAPSDEFWLVSRVSDASNFWRFGRRDGGPYELQKVAGGAPSTATVTKVASVPVAAGDVLTCAVTTSGITCRANNVLVAYSTDTFNASATAVGLAAWEPSGPSPVRLDNVGVTDLPREADLVAAVTSPSPVAVGEALTWTVTVRNLGAVAANAVGLSAPAPGGVSGLAAAPSSGTCSTSGALTCALGDLAPGATATVQVSAVAGPPGDSTLAVTATTSTRETHVSDNAASGTATIEPVTPPGVRLQDGFDRPDAAVLGAAPTGQAWVVHHGSFGVAAGRAAPTSTGYSMVVADSGGPTGTVTATLDAPSSEFWLLLRAADGANYWRFGRRQSGAYELQLIAGNGLGSPAVATSASVVPAAGDALECQVRSNSLQCSVNGVPVASTADVTHASATGAGFASFGSTDARFDDLAVHDLAQAADLSVTVGGAGSVQPGGSLQWTATITNVGDAVAAGASLSATVDPAPSGLGAATSAGTCTTGTGTVGCALDDVSPGASVQVVIDGTAPAAPGPVELSVTVTAPGDAEPGNDIATATTVVGTGPPPGVRVFDDFERATAATLGTAPTGQVWTHPHGALGVTAGRAAPTTAGYAMGLVEGGGNDGVVSVSVPVTSSEYWLVVRASTGQDHWRFGRAGGGSYQLQQIVGGGLGQPAVTTVAAPAPASGDRLSCRYLGASIACAVNGLPVSSASGADPAARLVGVAAWDPGAVAPTRFDDVEVVDVPPVLDVSVAVADIDPVLVGGAARWTLTVRNQGTVGASGVALQASLPAGVSGPAVQSSQGTCQLAATVTCSIGSLAAGATAEVVVTATAPNDPALLSVTATVSIDGDDAVPANDTDTETTTVRLPPPPGARVTDGFDGSGPLATTDTGEAWVVESGGFTASGGELAPTSAAPSVAAIEAGFSYGTYELTVSEVGDRRFWLAFRVVDGLNYFRIGPDHAGIYRLEKVVNGQPQPVAISIHRTSVVAADGDVIRLVTRPDDGMFVAVNNIHVVDAGDVQSMTVSRFGVASASSSVRFDHLDIGQVATASVLIGDTFSRADGTPMGRVESGVSYDWWSRGGGEWGIDGGRAYATGAGYTLVGADTASESADFRATIARLADEYALVFRYSEDDTYYRFGRLRAGEGYGIDLVSGWSSSPPPFPVERLADPVPADGDVVEIRQHLDGRIECLVNGSVVLRLTDTVTNIRGTIYGFATSGSTARFDDVVIVPE